MNELFSSHGRISVFALVMAALSAVPVYAEEDRCPENSHPAYEANNVVHCQCNDAFAAYNNRCQYKVAVEDQLQQKILTALGGIRSSMEALDADRSGLIYVGIRNQFKRIEVSIGLAYLSGSPIALAPEALSLSSDLGSTLAEWRTCTATPELKVECDNLHNFQRVLNEAATELIRVQRQ